MNAVSKVYNSKPSLNAIWDARRLPLLVGYQLLFAEQLLIQQKLYDVRAVHVYVRGASFKQKPLFSHFSHITNCTFIESLGEVQKGKSEASVFWNPFSSKEKAENLPDTTLYIQRFYKEKGYIPHLAMKKELVDWAKKFYKTKIKNKLPVVVHLKRNAKNGEQSNADLTQWYNFFKRSLQFSDIKYILIGNEAVSEDIESLPNVLFAQKHGSNLAKDLALIQTAYFFMGMASGPCNMAILSDVPYVIFKDPKHHTEEMKRELGNKDHFVFAEKNQNFIRKHHTTVMLMDYFIELRRDVTKKQWRDRVNINK